MSTEYKDHPLASILPLMGKMEIQELAADIQANGLRIPITLLDGMILDGRNRYRACEVIGVEPAVREFNGEGDPVDFIVSVNVKRRHLTTSQRAMVAARLANLPRGNPRFSEGSPKSARLPNRKTDAEAAKELEVGERTVRDAKTVLRDAPKESIKAVEEGKKTVNQAVRAVKESKTKTLRLDETGYPIPESVLELWQRAEAFKSNLQAISRIKGEISKGLDEKDPIFRELNSSVIAMLQNLYSELKCVIPYAVCTTCQGHQEKNCTLCKTRGFISHFAYKQFVPAETKALRERARAK
jgi:hypothetical protein